MSYHSVDQHIDNFAKAKTLIRKEMRARLQKISDEALATASEKICSHIANHHDFLTRTETISVFSALESEIDLSSLHQLLPNKKLVYPLCHKGGRLSFHFVTDPSELTPGMLGILEPKPDRHKEIPIPNINLFLCPGLAFAHDGKRLGHGGGFYDRALHKKSATALTCGIAMHQQILPVVPHDHHDILMNLIATEDGILPTIHD